MPSVIPDKPNQFDDPAKGSRHISTLIRKDLIKTARSIAGKKEGVWPDFGKPMISGLLDIIRGLGLIFHTREKMKLMR